MVDSPEGAWVEVNVGRRGKGPIQRVTATYVVATNGRTKWRTINEPTPVKCCRMTRIISPQRVLGNAGLKEYDPALNPFTSIVEQLEFGPEVKSIHVEFTPEGMALFVPCAKTDRYPTDHGCPDQPNSNASKAYAVDLSQLLREKEELSDR